MFYSIGISSAAIRGHGGDPPNQAPISYLVMYELFGTLIYCVPPSPRPQGLYVGSSKAAVTFMHNCNVHAASLVTNNSFENIFFRSHLFLRKYLTPQTQWKGNNFRTKKFGPDSSYFELHEYFFSLLVIEYCFLQYEIHYTLYVRITVYLFESDDFYFRPIKLRPQALAGVVLTLLLLALLSMSAPLSMSFTPPTVT